MIEIVGRTMRLVFQRPSVVSTASTVDPAASPLIDFSAWAEDCRLFGTLALDGDRLGDMLNLFEELVLIDVRAQGLGGGPISEIPELAISRDDILIAEASGPRGDPARRRHMQAVPITVYLGDFRVRGDIHVSPGADPVGAMSRRAPMIALTDAQVTYRDSVERLSGTADATVLFNRHLLTRVDVAGSYSPRVDNQSGAA